jgi:hypothetical protein
MQLRSATAAAAAARLICTPCARELSNLVGPCRASTRSQAPAASHLISTLVNSVTSPLPCGQEAEYEVGWRAIVLLQHCNLYC